MQTKPLIEFPLLAAIWGSSFIFMKIGGAEFGPILFMALRTLIASLFLYPLLIWYKQTAALSGYWRKIFIVGAFNTAIPFVLFGWATLYLSAGMTSVLNATTPMFGAIVAFIWLKDRLTISAIIGLLIGFIGVYFLMLDKLLVDAQTVIIPTLAVLLASLCYGLSANYTKRYLSQIKPLALAAGSQISASVILIPISLLFLPQQMPSIAAFSAVMAIGIICTGIAYIIFFRLISALGPAKAISVTYLIPVFGLFWGALFLHEVISFWMIIGCLLILTGVALTTGVIKIKNFKPLAGN